MPAWQTIQLRLDRRRRLPGMAGRQAAARRRGAAPARQVIAMALTIEREPRRHARSGKTACSPRSRIPPRSIRRRRISASPPAQHIRETCSSSCVREDGVAIGCGAIEKHDGYAEMKSVYLMPQARGRRLGQAIITELESVARSLGYDEIRLETGNRSPWAIEDLRTRRLSLLRSLRRLSGKRLQRLHDKAAAGRCRRAFARRQASRARNKSADTIGGDQP